MWKLFNFYLGYDYVAWANVADNGIARVHVDGLGRVFYWRYKSTRVADIIVEPSRVIWLTCSPKKYFGSGTDGSPAEKQSGAKKAMTEKQYPKLPEPRSFLCEMHATKAAPQPAENFWAQVDAMRSELAADIREVFDANGPETPQIARDVIEYADSWLQVAIQRESERSAWPQPAAPAAQEDALPREDFAWMVVQEACETEPADEDDPECIRILRRDLKSAVLAAFLREDAARAQQEHKP